MRSGYLHVVALLSLNGLVSSTPAPHRDATPHAPLVPRSPFPNRKVFIPQWEVQAHPDGEKIKLNGTAQEVLKQLRSINPDYDSHFGLDEEDEEAETGLQERQIPGTGTNVLFQTVICNQFEKAYQKRVLEGAQYLRRTKGQPELSAGPQECGRVSCAYNAAIWWCNDNRHQVVLGSFGVIADGTFAITQACTQQKEKVSGLAIHEDNWSVGIRHDPC